VIRAGAFASRLPFYPTTPGFLFGRWLWRGGSTRSHPELGSENPLRGWYCRGHPVGEYGAAGLFLTRTPASIFSDRGGRSCVPGAPPPGPLPARSSRRGGARVRRVLAHSDGHPAARYRRGIPRGTPGLCYPEGGAARSLVTHRTPAPTEGSTLPAWWPGCRARSSPPQSARLVLLACSGEFHPLPEGDGGDAGDVRESTTGTCVRISRFLTGGRAKRVL
jgi:hypothetical protein